VRLTRVGQTTDAGQVLFAAELLHGGCQELRRLRLVRGTYRRTARRIAEASAAVALALSLLGAPGLTLPARADSTPSFGASSANPFGLPDVGADVVPAFVDIDGDGDLDAFIGAKDGNTIFFRNTGTVTAPLFGTSSANPFGLADVGRWASPIFVDIDGDGDLDALVGEEYGNTVFFENTGTATAPLFGTSSANPFGLGGVGAYAAPRFADIDGDGDLDAFIGKDTGDIVFFRNTGTATVPDFGASSANPFNLTNVGYLAVPDFADIDDDGDLDAFVGESGGNTVFFRNTGSATSAVFAAPSTNPFNLTNVGLDAAPRLADIDGDGDLDAFVGDFNGDTIFFANAATDCGHTFQSTSTNPFGLGDVGLFAIPDFADIDGDGDLDAFVSESAGNTIFFRNTGEAVSPAFAASSSNPFGLTDVGEDAAPDLVDIDSDGDLDAFVGAKNGDTIFFRNTGTAISPAFGTSSANPFGLANVVAYAVPAFVDIDADGDLDAFIGESGGNMIFFRNTGTVTSPAFAAPSTNPFSLVDVGLYSTPQFVDFDADGDLDAFVGNHDGNTIFFLNTGTATSPAFATSSVNPLGLANVGYDAVPRFADIDADGDLDAFVGESAGNSVFFDAACSVPTPTPTETKTATQTATNTVPTNTPTQTATNTVPTNTPTQTATNTVPTNTPTQTATNTVPTNTPTQTATNTVPTETPTQTATNTVPTETPTQTATNTVPTETPTQTATNTVPTETPTQTATNTVPTNTPTQTATNTVPTETPTQTATNTVPTETPTQTATNTVPTETPTQTATNTVPTNTPTQTATNTVPTNTPTQTATNTVPTNTPTQTATNTVPTETPTQTATNTVPTNTPTQTATNTVPTETPTQTATNTVPTNTPTQTATNTVPTDTPTQTATVTATLSPVPASCAVTPVSGCTTPGRALLKFRNNADPTKRRFMWKWTRGTSSKSEFGNPVTGATEFALCLYDDAGRQMSARVGAGGTCDGKACWSEVTPGFKYKIKLGNQNGVASVLLREGTTGSGIVMVKGKGSNLALPVLPLSSTEVKVQLVKDAASGPQCWESTFTAPPVKDDGTQFSDKMPQ
jgi:hypothetical protein